VWWRRWWGRRNASDDCAGNADTNTDTDTHDESVWLRWANAICDCALAQADGIAASDCVR